MQVLTKNGIKAKFVNILKNEHTAITIAADVISPNANTINTRDATKSVMFDVKTVGSIFLYADSSEALSDFPALYSVLTVFA